MKKILKNLIPPAVFIDSNNYALLFGLVDL